MTRGKLISFEGIDGCGKTTQLRMLERILTSRNIPFVSTREPGGTALGKMIRAALLNVSPHSVDPLAELLLYAADRAQHVRELIAPNLASGVLVLTDRFYDATTAYQGYGRGFDLMLIRQLNDLATGGIKPDVTLLFDIDVQTGLERIHRRGGEAISNADETQANRLDREPLEFHERVRQGYLELAQQEPNRFRIIPASGSIEAVRPLVIEALRGII
ncbi:MAG TPA: dTMP kinase [Blastocatellia bacterium]|nr:dTMP kinase [Blastocatellia bacterium]